MAPMRAQLSAVSLISIMLCGVVRSMDSLQTAQFIDFLRRSRVTSLSVYCLQLGQRMRSKVKSEVEKFMANRFLRIVASFTHFIQLVKAFISQPERRPR